ncbi:MAG: TrkA family potassium uptake protein [Firmicutes bacterium]|nr:TrkA family potassium uptake protein [Bacillota bacterium]
MARPKRFAIIGLGIFGSILCRQLSSQGRFEILAVDTSEDKVEAVKEFVSYGATADATDEKVFNALGIKDFDVLVVCTASNLEASVMISLMAKQAGVKVVAKAKSLSHKTVLERIGVDLVIIPELEMGKKLATRLINPDAVDVFSLFENYNIIEVITPEEWVGQSIAEISFRDVYNITLLLIKRGEQFMHYVKRDTKIEEGDLLVVGGSPQYLDKFMNRINKLNA